MAYPFMLNQLIIEEYTIVFVLTLNWHFRQVLIVVVAVTLTCAYTKEVFLTNDQASVMRMILL